MMDHLARILRPLKQRIMLMIGRGILKAVADDEETGLQTFTAQLLDGEIAQNLEIMQHYGLASTPPAGADMVVLFPCGDRSLGISVAEGERRSRPVDLAAGEVAIYGPGDQSEDGGHRVHLKAERVTEAACASFVINLNGTPLTITAVEGVVTITAPGVVTINDTVIPAPGESGTGRPGVANISADTVNIDADDLTITLGGKTFSFDSSGMPARIGTDKAGGDVIQEGP